jgi:hypothetical protein
LRGADGLRVLTQCPQVDHGGSVAARPKPVEQ